MDIQKIVSACDHTLLSVTATEEEIFALCDDAIAYGTATVCIPPRFVRVARCYVGDRMKICTVIGFPNGYSTKEVKVAEALDAIRNGADEIDTVIPVGALKAGNDEDIRMEIAEIKAAIGSHILKVIVETCLLTEDEKIRACRIVSESGADYIKTSTGFSTAGATFADVELFRKHVAPHVRIKAAGGIATLEDAEKFLSLGASRLGTSRIVRLVKEAEKKG